MKLAPRKQTKGVQLSTIDGHKQGTFDRATLELEKNFAEQQLRRTAAKHGLDFIDLFGLPIDLKHLVRMTKEEVEEYDMGVFKVDTGKIYIATNKYNPEKQSELWERFEHRGYEVKVYVTNDDGIEKILKTYDNVVKKRKIKDILKIDTNKFDDSIREDSSMQEVSDLLEEAENMTITDVFAIILTAAYRLNISDIHIEPEKDDVTIRFRLDGVLMEATVIDQKTNKALENRIKLVADLMINVDNRPQDGSFSYNVDEKQIDVRVSMLPSNYGYSIVMRLLGTGNVGLDFESLGFSSIALDVMMRQTSTPQGMILVTGPTGSGKTTTLYTVLNYVNDGQKKIITLEDPIEYKLEGISQTQIDKEAGYTFGGGLRSILRQDPDVVMVGEIRDDVTASTAIDAALTGHKVLSTLHTNDSIATIARLLELGVHGYSLADAISVIVAQRLLRRLCNSCKYAVNIDPADQQFIIESLKKLPLNYRELIGEDLVFYSSSGCDECSGTGYKGRVGVYELFFPSTAVKQLMSKEEPSVVDIRVLAEQEGMVTMLQDAIIKAAQGLTDIKEIRRVLVSE